MSSHHGGGVEKARRKFEGVCRVIGDVGTYTERLRSSLIALISIFLLPMIAAMSREEADDDLVWAEGAPG